MKNRKTFVGIALLLVVLVLGIAYAAITDTLKITGTATTAIDANNFKVVFTGETTPEGTVDGVTATAEADTTTARLEVTGLSKKGDTKTATYKIKNKSADLNARVNVGTQTVTNDDYFNVVATLDETELDVNGEATVTVTVTLEKTPVEELTGDIDITLDAEAVVR